MQKPTTAFSPRYWDVELVTIRSLECIETTKIKNTDLVFELRTPDNNLKGEKIECIVLF